MANPPAELVPRGRRSDCEDENGRPRRRATSRERFRIVDGTDNDDNQVMNVVLTS